MYEIPNSTPFGSPQLASKPLSQTWLVGPRLQAGYLAVDLVIVSSWFMQCSVWHLNFKTKYFEELNFQRYCHILPFDKKLSCLTNDQERRSFPWPLVNNKGESKWLKPSFIVSAKNLHKALVVFLSAMQPNVLTMGHIHFVVLIGGTFYSYSFDPKPPKKFNLIFGTLKILKISINK